MLDGINEPSFLGGNKIYLLCRSDGKSVVESNYYKFLFKDRIWLLIY